MDQCGLLAKGNGLLLDTLHAGSKLRQFTVNTDPPIKELIELAVHLGHEPEHGVLGVFFGVFNHARILAAFGGWGQLRIERRWIDILDSMSAKTDALQSIHFALTLCHLRGELACGFGKRSVSLRILLAKQASPYLGKR